LKNTIIAFFTARGEDYAHIAGLEAGADDYISKLIKPKVFISKIKALLRRFEIDDQKTNKEQISDFMHKLVIDKEKYIAIKNGNQITMPRKEFELLLMLSSKPEKVFTREEIFNKIWGDDVIVGERTIDVHIRKLREKIGENKIKTVKGVGYKYFE